MTKPRRPLPTRLHLSHGAYYYVSRENEKVKWRYLSRDYAEALRLLAGIESTVANTMPSLLDRWFSAAELAPKTRRTYRVAVERLKSAFLEFSPAAVKPRDFYEFITLAKITHSMASHYRSVMVGAMGRAVREGLVERNLMTEIEQFPSRKRDRYITDAEFLAIREKATPTLRTIMDLCYLTGQRIGDVLGIRHSDLGEDGISFVQQKTGARLCVAWSPDLREVVAEAKALHRSLRGLTLLHTRRGGTFSYSTIRTLWDRATAASGVKDAHLHDIRAKAATDAKKAGVDSMALLGHKSEQGHLSYLRGKETPVVEGIRRVRC